ncbi:MAG: CsgG/HfaB family protein [Bacteroidales bacterium]|jgi:curli biogenesis system outer membrane secretion channel CsgG
MKIKSYILISWILLAFPFIQPAEAQNKDDENTNVPFPQYTPSGNEPKVTILDFTNESFFESGVLGKAASTMFISALAESGRFILVDRALLTAKVTERNLSFDKITNDQLLEICKELNIKYIISGSVTEFGIKKTGTTVKTKVTDANTSLGGGISMEMGKGTARVAIDIKFTDVQSRQVSLTASAVGTAISKNSVFGLEMLLPIEGVKTGIEFGSGVSGFDNTLAGRGIRNASRQLVNNIIESKIYNWSSN